MLMAEMPSTAMKPSMILVRNLRFERKPAFAFCFVETLLNQPIPIPPKILFACPNLPASRLTRALKVNGIG